MDKVTTNRAMALGTSAQGDFPKVLCVCSAGILRSATMAWVLSNPPFNFNTRSCGADPAFALINIDYGLLHWAQYGIVCAERKHAEAVERHLKLAGLQRDVFTLNIPDDFDFRDPTLVSMIEVSCRRIFLDTN